jgi:hypothetical protein
VRLAAVSMVGSVTERIAYTPANGPQIATCQIGSRPQSNDHPAGGLMKWPTDAFRFHGYGSFASARSMTTWLIADADLLRSRAEYINAEGYTRAVNGWC